MNSTSSSPQNIRRCQVTPEFREISGRSAARCTASPGSGGAAAVDGCWCVGVPGSNSTSSTVTPNSEASAYRVRTDGPILPVSICEIELGARSRRRASSRTPIPLRMRRARSRRPSSLGDSAPLVADWCASIASCPGWSNLWLSGRALCAAPDLAVDDRSRDDQEALEDVLPLLVEAEEGGRVQHLHAQPGRHHGADERAPPAEQAGAAEHHRGDRGERVAGSLTGIADAELGQ